MGKKQIARQKKRFNDLLGFKISEDIANGFIEIGRNALLQKVDFVIDGFIDLPDYSDDSVVVSRK